MTTRLLFKVLGEDGAACHGGRGKWPLPTKNEDGTWTPGTPLSVAGRLVPCENGLHLARPADLTQWLGPTTYLVQVPEGVEEVEADDKIVVRTARLERRLETWNERTARHFACDCAERVLHLTTDPRPAEAIRIARLFADGMAGQKELAAAWAAAGIATRDAARDATWAAARDAAGDAAKEWQAARLMEYLRGERP